ncbi:MAG: hypothetical protein Q9208_002621 [Pyrenodesmia sp. 3 TL-2023]
MSTPSPSPRPSSDSDTPTPTRPINLLPSNTGANYASTPSSTNQDSTLDDRVQDNSILNYYFLLLALLIIILGIIYLSYAKRHRQKIARSRQSGQRALARDVERWGGGSPWGPARVRHPRVSPRHHPRRDEGLDERGEAPPPYVPKEPEPAYTGLRRSGSRAGQDIPLQDMDRSDQKPPDYDEGPSSAAGGHSGAGAGPIMRNG